MPTRSVIFAILLAAGLFGLLVSGCNNGKRTASTTRQTRGQLAQARPVRPAEVLSASAHRSQTQQVRPQSRSQYADRSRVVEPLPEPVVLAQAPARRAAAYVPPAPVYHSAPVTAPAAPVYEQPRVFTTGPELAMAQSALSPMAAPAIQQGYRSRRISSAPIPELEPVRQRRMPSPLTTSRPVAEVMMSSSRANQDLRHALAPLGGEPVLVEKGWVSSPTTAMRY